MTAAVSQKEYIKRYLSKSDDKKKKKKKKRDVTSQSKLRIVDDDIDLSSMRPVGDEELELYNLDEDAPQVAGIVDERPEELRTIEEFRTSKRWKVVCDSTSDIQITEINASSGSNNHENNVTSKMSSVHGSKGAESDDSSLQHSIRDSKQHREDSYASPPRKSRAPSSSKPFLEKASAVQIKSERITDSDSDISVSRKSDFRHRNEREPKVSKKQDVKQELPDRHKGTYDNSKKMHLENESDRSHHMFQGADTKTKTSSSKERWRNDAKSGHKRNFMTTDDESICNGLDVKQPKISRNKHKHDSDSYTHGKNFSKQNQNHRSETLSERNHNEFHRGTLLKDGQTSSNRKNESGEDCDSDLSLLRKSRKTERGKHSSYEQKKELDEGSDSDLSLPRPSKITDKEKNKKREKVKKKHWKKDMSEQSDSDLSPPRPSQSRDRDKQKRQEEVKKRHRKTGSSEESDSDLSLPRSSKSKEKHKRPEAKKRHREKGSNEESDSALSPPRLSKSKEKYKSQEEMKKRHRKNELSEESDSDLSLPRSSKRKEKHRRQEEVEKSNRKKGSSEESDSDLSVPQPSNSIGREKFTMREVKKRHRKRGLSEQSDSDLSPPRHSEIIGREKQRKSEVKKIHRKKGSSEESDSALSLPRPSKSKEKHKRPEDVKKRHRKKGSSEESASDSSPSQVSKSRDRINYNNVEVNKKCNRKESSDKGSDSNSSPRPSKNKNGNKHGIANERANVNDRSKLDMRIPQSRQKDREKSSQRKAQSAYSKKKRQNSDSSGPQTPERSNRYDHLPVGGKHSNSRACSPEERHARKHDSHGTSSRREARYRSNSPPRRPPHSDHKSDRNSSVRNSRSPEAGNRKLQKTLDGKRAGLQDAKLLKEELKSFAERENNMFSKMSDDVSGRLAEAVQRDRKTGKKRDLDEEARQHKEKEEKDRKFKEKYSRWGKGLKQVEEQKQNLEEAVKLMAKPLARYADDEDLDKLLRDQEREGDPMLEYIRSKKSDSDSKTSAKPKYQGSYPTNRFGIPPGYRWDGVDRSNDYEKQWFEQRSAQKASEEEAYKWSTADM